MRGPVRVAADALPAGAAAHQPAVRGAASRSRRQTTPGRRPPERAGRPWCPHPTAAARAPPRLPVAPGGLRPTSRLTTAAPAMPRHVSGKGWPAGCHLADSATALRQRSCTIWQAPWSKRSDPSSGLYGVTISEAMWCRFWLVPALLVALAVPVAADNRDDAIAQLEFGIARRPARTLERGCVSVAEGRRARSRRTRPPGTTSASASSSSAASTTRGKPTRRHSRWIRATRSSATTTICSGKSMTARTVVAIGSLTLALVSAGCLKFYEVPVEIPIQAKIDVARFQRVLIAGFLSGRNQDDRSKHRDGAAASQPAPHQAGSARHRFGCALARRRSRPAAGRRYGRRAGLEGRRAEDQERRRPQGLRADFLGHRVLEEPGERVRQPAHRHRVGAVR